MTICTDIHPLSEVLSPHEGHGSATAYSGYQWVKMGYALDKSPVHRRRTTIHFNVQL